MACIDVTLPAVTTARPLLLVAACALIDGTGHVLLAERPAGKMMAGLWEFPGGKVGSLETPEAALSRELREELGITAGQGCFLPLAFASHPYEAFHLLMPLYVCRLWNGTPHPREGQKLAWIKPADLGKYPLLPADYIFIEPLRAL